MILWGVNDPPFAVGLQAAGSCCVGEWIQSARVISGLVCAVSAGVPAASLLTFTSDPQVWSQNGFYPSEPVFVPSPDAQDEDDGVILSVVLTPSQVRLETGPCSWLLSQDNRLSKRSTK